MPEEEVDGAVERVDDPAQPARAGPVVALLPHDRVVGPGGLEPRADQPLGRDVGLGDEVGRRALGADREPAVAEPENASRSPAPASCATSGREREQLAHAGSAAGGRAEPAGRGPRAARRATAASPRRRAGRRAGRRPGSRRAPGSTGTAAAGWPVWFQSARWAVKFAMSLSISGAGRPSHSPTRGGRRVSVGVSSTSKSARTRVRRASRSAASCAWARAHERTPGSWRPVPASPRVQRASRSGCGIARGVAVDPLEVARDDVRRDVAVVGIALLDVVAEVAQALGRRDRRRRAARRRAGRSAPRGIASE